MPETSFCIIAQPRTGSNHLCGLLNSHPEIVCHYELFNRWRIYSLFEERNGYLHLAKRQLGPVRFLEDLRAYTQQRRPEARAFGFKLMLAQSRSALRHVCHTSQYRKIVLHRENKLAQYSSEKIALRTRQYVTKNGAKAATTRVEFVPDEFERFLEKDRQAYAEVIARLTSHKQPVFEIEYGQLDDEGMLNELMAFIGVERRSLQDTTVVKQNPSAVLRRFSNPEAAVAALRGTQMSRWLT
jgi:LPS sulfotransferase NodH